MHPDDVNKYGPPPNVDIYDWNQALQECPDREWYAGGNARMLFFIVKATRGHMGSFAEH